MSEIGKSNKGKKLSDEHRKKMSKAKIGKYVGENNPNYGKKLSEEHRKKLIENSGQAKKVICIETQQIFSSALQAAKAVGLKSSSGISKCCAKQAFTAGGFH